MVSALVERVEECSSTGGSSFGDEGSYCAAHFDSLLCWPQTPASSIAVMPCFSSLNGIRYDITQNATRECLPTGAWAEYTDYSNCRELENDHIVNDHVPHSIELTTTIYLFGYTVSLIALAVAVYIFCRYKDLRCLRNTIHMNLMISFILVDFLWIGTLLVQVFLGQETFTCIFLIVLLHYFHLTNFFWMFVEGMYLYVLVVKTFRADRIKLPLCVVVGWVIPGAFTLTWCVSKAFRLYHEDPHELEHLRSCPWKSDSFDWIYQVPSIFVLAANVIFLVVIMWVLITKLRSANTVETQQYQKAAKALLVLIPLLGMTYIVVLIGPSEPGLLRSCYECLRAVLLSTQGFTVAVFYCFLNTEVKNTVTHHINSWHTHRSLSQRSSSQRNRNSSRDWSRRSKGDSIRLYQTVNMFKKRESSCSVGTTTSLVVGINRNNSQQRRFTAPTFTSPIPNLNHANPINA